jgi:type VI protein secretion system component VasK
MTSDRLFSNLRVLWRADRIIADIRLRHLLARSAINAVAMLIAVFGLLFLEIAAYFALVQVVSAILAAALLGAVNLVIGALLMVIAAKRKPDRELEVVRDIHKNAVEALQLDIQELQAQLHRAPRLDVIVPVLLPFVGLILRSLKKHKASVQRG